MPGIGHAYAQALMLVFVLPSCIVSTILALSLSSVIMSYAIMAVWITYNILRKKIDVFIASEMDEWAILVFPCLFLYSSICQPILIPIYIISFYFLVNG